MFEVTLNSGEMLREVVMLSCWFACVHSWFFPVKAQTAALIPLWGSFRAEITWMMKESPFFVCFPASPSRLLSGIWGVCYIRCAVRGAEIRRTTARLPDSQAWQYAPRPLSHTTNDSCTSVCAAHETMWELLSRPAAPESSCSSSNYGVSIGHKFMFGGCRKQ